jgi:hypothetical protein
MRLNAFLILMVMTLATVGALESKQAAASQKSAEKSAEKSADRISGDWDVTFELQGMKVPASFTFKLDGDKLTGTADSQHTGHGTLSDGTFADNKLSFTANFAAHESIAVTGTLKDDKLSGEFRTEGRQGTWEATKKK